MLMAGEKRCYALMREAQRIEHGELTSEASLDTTKYPDGQVLATFAIVANAYDEGVGTRQNSKHSNQFTTQKVRRKQD
jgi:hypothetical protein